MTDMSLIRTPPSRRIRHFIGGLGLMLASVIAMPLFATDKGVAPQASSQAKTDGTKVALVIGNASYDPNKGLSRLNSPVEDARAMKLRLERLGFEVIYRENIRSDDLVRGLLDQFAQRLQPGGVALFYFSGHGLMLSDRGNYMATVDAELTGSEAGIKYRSIALDDVLAKMREARTAVNLAYLDACRNNPYTPADGKKGGRKGLGEARLQPGDQDTMVFYAAQPGDTALDGTKGGLSVYTQALLETMEKPGLAVEQVHKEALRLVRQRTGKNPYSEGSMARDFYFIQINQPSQGESSEVVYWNSIKDSADASEFEAYLKRFPNGTFRELADSRLKRLQVQVDVPPPAVVQSSLFRPAPVTTPVAVLERPAAVPAQEVRVVTASPNPLKQEDIHGWDAARVQVLQRDTARALGREVVIKEAGHEMVLIPAGCFLMGHPENEKGQGSNEGQHRACVKAFEMGKTEVTQGQWKAVMGENPSRFKGALGGIFGGCDACPVENVSWGHAQAFIKKLNEQTRQSYRLPSEAEWEYAARAGTTTRFSTGDCITTDQANFNGITPASGCPKGEYREKTLTVGSFSANAWGLHDMHGNVWEWVQDCWRNSFSGAPDDGSARSDSNCGGRRVIRGGAWNNDGGWLSHDFRYSSTGNIGDHGILGFRLSRSR